MTRPCPVCHDDRGHLDGCELGAAQHSLEAATAELVALRIAGMGIVRLRDDDPAHVHERAILALCAALGLVVPR